MIRLLLCLMLVLPNSSWSQEYTQVLRPNVRTLELPDIVGGDEMLRQSGLATINSADPGNFLFQSCLDCSPSGDPVVNPPVIVGCFILRDGTKICI